jgi:RNA polymerase sigma-70 factor (ECF subfamily)
LKNEVLNDYIINGKIDIDKIIDDFYGYVYIVVKNGVSISITNEDIEEIISDIFVALWKNSDDLLKVTAIKPYLAGIAKNVIRNKYRNIELNFSISDYEENLVDTYNIEKITEENEQNKVILDTLKTLKIDEYKIFIMFYYESKSIKEIAKILNYSTSNVKTILHRVRKIIKRNLEDGGYSYGK